MKSLVNSYNSWSRSLYFYAIVQPANIMFREDKIKIGDFGLATEDSQGEENPIERTICKGTRLYMAPEQVG